MDRFRQDLRHAFNHLLRDRTFAVIAVLTLGLGIGANTAIFSIVRAVLLEPLPYAAPERLVIIWNQLTEGETTWLSLQEVVSYGKEAGSLESVGAFSQAQANITGGQEPERVRAAIVTANLFHTLDVKPAVGRGFDTADGAPGASPVVVIGHGLWQRRFGGALDVIGTTVQINGVPRTIVGVMPASFRLPLDYREERPSELWLPVIIDPANLGAWGNRSYIGVGRLRSSAEASTTTAEFSVIADRWVRAGFVRLSPDATFARTAVPLQHFVTGRARTALLLLVGAVIVVLLLACANVMNLMLAKADARSREVAVRIALGASRWQLLRQLLTESMVLSTVGAVVGVAIAAGAVELLTTLRPVSLPRVENVRLDGTMLALTAGLAILTGLLVGFAPALQLARPSLASILREGGRTGTAGRARRTARRGLVVLQIACSVVLVVAAGLLIRSLVELNRIDVGFDASNVLTARLQLPATDYPRPPDVVRFYQQLEARVQELPGVTAAGSIMILPLSQTLGDWSITIEGRPPNPNENPNGDYQAVTPGYFTAMGLQLVRGRVITASDGDEAPLSAVVNDTMAERYWPGQDAIGKRFYMGTNDRPWLTIVGIVRTIRHNAIVEEPRAEMYVPHAQLPREIGGAPRSMTLVVKTQGNPLDRVQAIRDVIRGMDRNLPVSDIQTMERVTSKALSQPRFTALLLAMFAALALTLASVGIYGTISLLVSERSQEIGIRMALGAGRGSILRMVMAQGLSMAAIGIVVGLIGAVMFTRLLETLVYGVTTLDPGTLAAVPVVLTIVALLASLNPARRAAAVDPAVTLRG